MPAVTVYLPPVLRERTGNQARVSIEGATVRDLIEALERAYPGLRFHLCHETGELRPYVNIFIEKDNIRYLQGLDTPLQAGARVRILPSVAGG
jgi:molybdopterin synthase sulfur carrier subunit